jgi:hypothetical protein
MKIQYLCLILVAWIGLGVGQSSGRACLGGGELQIMEENRSLKRIYGL